MALKNRVSLKVVLFVFKIFKMAANIKINKIVKNSKLNRFQDPVYGLNLTFFAPWLPWQRPPF
jgi:hypothetical protein